MKKKSEVVMNILWVCSIAVLVWCVISFAEVNTHNSESGYEYNKANAFVLLTEISDAIHGKDKQQEKMIKVEPTTLCERESEKEVVELPTDPNELERVRTSMKFLHSSIGKYTLEYCYEMGISPYLVIAIIERESGFDENSIGDQGKAYGLGQIHPDCVWDRYERVGITCGYDLFDGRNNVRMMVDILLGYAETNDDVYSVLMRYNGGPTNDAGYDTNPSKYAVEVADFATYLQRIDEAGAWDED